MRRVTFNGNMAHIVAHGYEDWEDFRDDGRPKVFNRGWQHIIWSPKYL